MLLDLRAEGLRKINWVASAGGIVVALVFLIQISPLSADSNWPSEISRRCQDRQSTTVHNIGRLLFANYNLPFQIIGVVVLVATIAWSC